MQTARTDDPPHIPLRFGGWPVRRMPRWTIAAFVVLLAFGVSVALSHRPSTAERGTDLSTLFRALTTDVQSCAGGVRESLYVLRKIDSGASHDTATAINVATVGAANCSPANNELLANLTSEQVPESLTSYHLKPAVTALIDWAAPNAAQVMSDIAAILTDRGKPAEAADRAALRTDLGKLDAQRQRFYSILRPAIRALSPAAKPPVLPG